MYSKHGRFNEGKNHFQPMQSFAPNQVAYWHKLVLRGKQGNLTILRNVWVSEIGKAEQKLPFGGVHIYPRLPQPEKPPRSSGNNWITCKTQRCSQLVDYTDHTGMYYRIWWTKQKLYWIMRRKITFLKCTIHKRKSSRGKMWQHQSLIRYT